MALKSIQSLKKREQIPQEQKRPNENSNFPRLSRMLLSSRSYRPKTSLDIFSLGQCESTQSSFLIGKRGSVSGKKGYNGLLQSSTKEGQVALYSVSAVLWEQYL